MNILFSRAKKNKKIYEYLHYYSQHYFYSFVVICISKYWLELIFLSPVVVWIYRLDTQCEKNPYASDDGVVQKTFLIHVYYTL